MPGDDSSGAVIPSEWHLVDFELPTLGDLSRLTSKIREAQAIRDDRAAALAEAGFPVGSN